MKTVSPEAVEAAWDKVAEADEQKSQEMAERMMREQPYIMIYLLATDENLFEEDERGRLMELGAVIYEAMSQGERLKEVTDRDLDKAEAANMKTLRRLDKGSEMDLLNAAQGLIETYNQRYLMRSLLEALMSGHEDAPDLAPENIGEAWIYLKAVIDCLDRES